MKKYTIIAYTILILIVLLSGLFFYKVFGKNNSSNEKIEEKALSEVKHLESEFQNLFNQLNNISFENYKISSSDIKEENDENKSSNSEQKSSSSETNNTEKTENQEESNSTEENKKYELEKKGVLTENTEIDWKKIKNDVEKIYTYLYSMTLDLYQTSTNNQDITNFNKEYDNLAKAVKDENKEDSLKELSILYDYLPKFIENCTDDEKEKTVIKTKNYIFKAYSILDKEDWSDILNNINSATQEFTKLVTNIDNKENKNQYTINKIYVMINELQNAVSLEDKEVFLIKYKNLLEELQNMI